jgi:hypothetical protein
MQTDPTACHSLIGPLAALLPSHGSAPTGLRDRRVRCHSVTMSRVIVPGGCGLIDHAEHGRQLIATRTILA